MPTTYTHDLFGKKVYRQLPREIRKVIRENGNLFRIGLHGPDILFYDLFNQKVCGLGTEMHKIPAASFFLRGMSIVRRTGDERFLAYLLGFACHYLLDSSCHPFVDETAEKKILSHTLLEKEFDRTLMVETNRNPHHYYPSDCIVPRMDYAKVIHCMFPMQWFTIIPENGGFWRPLSQGSQDGSGLRLSLNILWKRIRFRGQKLL